MRNKSVMTIIGWLAFVILTACASMGPIAENAATPAQMGKTYVEQAQINEREGDLVQAAQNYKLALTVNPQDQVAAGNLTRIENRRRLLAQDYYQKGVGLYAKGKYADSRQALLTALRLQPDHSGALEKLKARTRIAAKRFIVHTVQPGESMSEIAKKYYGDPMQYAVIANYNNLPDATQIRLGQELKIPEIEGLPFKVDDQTQQIRTEAADSDSLAAWPAEEPESYGQRAKGIQVLNQVAGYREAGLDLLREKKYDAAIVEFSKVLSAQPHNEDAKSHIYKARYEWAQDLMREKKYISAKRQFEKCLTLNTSCQKCHTYIKQCESAYKEMHYQRGIELFGAEQPDQAIAEWEMVRKLDPNYKQVDQYIKKAKTISQKLEKLKKQKN